MNTQIDVIVKVNQQVDEILYLQRSRSDLKEFANQYVTSIKVNYDTISFFPSILSELKTSLEKKNFNISNAKEKIDRLNASIKKLEYIKSSIVGYDKITDNDIRKRTNLDAFKAIIHVEAQNASLSSVDNLYSQIANKYNEIQSQSIDVNDIKDKYSQLNQRISANRAILGDFIKVHNELNTFIVAMSLDKMKVEFYLKTFGDSMSKLNQINSYSMILNSITQDELRCISPRIINDLQQVRMITTYDSIAHHANNTQKLNESVTDNLKRLRDLRNSLAHLKLKINNNQNSFFNTDYRQILAEVAKIEPILHSNLDSNFTISAQMISSLDVKVISSLNKFSGINSKAQILVQQVESSKTSYWLEDYNEILSKIKVYKENHTSINYSEVLNLIDSKSLIKSSTIDVFVKANYFLLSETGLIKYINSNLRNRMISKREFVEFSHSALKWKGAKVLFYKIRALLIAIGKFLIKRSTLKYLAIISCIILAIIVIISYWMQILIIGGVILLTIGYFNSKK